MSKEIRQITVFISCPSDVESEKDIIIRLCDTFSNHIFARKGIHIKPVHWKKDVTPIITGDGPQDIIDRRLSDEDYDIYIGILWKRFGEPQRNGLTPTEGEFEDALKSYQKAGRPLIAMFFKAEKFYLGDENEALQVLEVQKFKKRVKSLGLYDSFATPLEFLEKAYVCVHKLVERITIAEDSEICFKRIRYPEIKDYLHRRVCPANKYKPDDFLMITDKFKEDITHIIRSHDRIALIGDAGSGKTFELERIANHFSQDNSPYYPLLIRLNTFANQSFEEVLPENWGNIPENQLLVILDGLDEIESKNKKDAYEELSIFRNNTHPHPLLCLAEPISIKLKTTNLQVH